MSISSIPRLNGIRNDGVGMTCGPNLALSRDWYPVIAGHMEDYVPSPEWAYFRFEPAGEDSALDVAADDLEAD